MPYSHPRHPHHHHTMVKAAPGSKAASTLVKAEERNKAAQLTFQTKKTRQSCICKSILVIFVLAGIVTSTVFMMHFIAQKLNLDQDYSKQLASRFVLPSFSSLRSTDSLYPGKKESGLPDTSSHDPNEKHSISKWFDQSYPKLKNSNNKKRKNSSANDSTGAGGDSSSRVNFTSMQFWNYFKSENAHLHPNRVRKTDISNEESGEVRLTIPQYATLKGLKLTEFGNKMFKFLSIPYAKAPIGELRFKEPVEYKPKASDSVLDTTKYGPICPQFFDEILVKTVTPLTRNMSEDCLTLNIWTPSLPKSNNVEISEKSPNPKSTNNLWTILTEDTMDFEDDESNSTSKKPTTRRAKNLHQNEGLLPVMVWIHGGGFSMGSTALDEYDGSILSSFGHVVVVTINYRLGIFGFFNLNSPEAAGNQGLKDQVMALKWVKKHVKNFGGDPNRITIFGQSAGGFAVGLHMISPNTKGLFRRAILQSGSPVVFDQFYQNTVNIAKRLVQYVDCEEKPNENPLADSSTEASTNEEESEEEGGEEESGDDAKLDDKVAPSAGPALNSEMKSNLEEDGLRRRKRADDEGDDDDGEEEEDDEKKNESTTTQSSSSSGSTSEVPSSSTSTTTSTTTTTTTTTTEQPASSTVAASSSSSTSKSDEEEEGDDNEEDSENEAKSSSTHSTEISASSSVSSTTESSSSTTARPTERTYFTTASVSSTSASPSLTPKKTGRLGGDLKKADKILKCMQSKTMKTLIKAQKNAMQNSMFPFSPNKHDSILPKMPGEVIKQDASSIYFHTDVEQVLLGVNKDEGSLYLHLTMPQLFPSENITLNINRLSDLRNMLATNLTNAFKVPRAQAVIVANLLLSGGPEIDTTENLVRKYYQLIADLMFNCPTVMLADELVKLDYQNESDKSGPPKKKQVYFYRFNERPSVTEWGEWFGVTHHEEVQFVFGMPLKYPLKYNSKDLLFSKRIMKTWAHFASTGEMLDQLDLVWPAYNQQQQLMELSAFESKLTEKLHEKNCNLFRIGFESFMKRRKRFVHQ